MKTLKAALYITAGLISACSFAGKKKKTGEDLVMVPVTFLFLVRGFLMEKKKRSI